MKALIFPNDPLISYVIKGEIKKNYFNPDNIFEEIHFITFAKKETSINDIKITTGRAKCFIHVFSPLSTYDFLYPLSRINKISNHIINLKFDVVRAYNPIIHGYIAGKISKKFDLPFIISLHGNYDLDIRYQYKKNKDVRYFKYLFTKYTIEKKALNMATHIIGAYEFASKFALDNGISEHKVTTIYNRVYLDFYKPTKFRKPSKELKVICVGRLIKEKGQRTLLKAMKILNKNITLTIVGDGEDFDILKKMVSDYDLKQRVKFFKSVANSELSSIYQEHEIFALPIKYGGICIPALEATACGLALVMPKPLHEDKSEIISEYSLIVENTPEGFARGINNIFSNSDLKKKMIKKGLDTILKYQGSVMETKEALLYKKIIENYEII